MDERGARNIGPDGALIKFANTIVASSIDFPEYNESLEDFAQLVTPQWVWDSIRTGQACPFSLYAPYPPKNKFARNCIVIAELSATDTRTIRTMVRALGGFCMDTLHEATMYVIAQDIHNGICKRVLQENSSVKIVHPRWLDDCIRYGGRVNETPHLLSHA